MSVDQVVGIPRGLYYYVYYPFWKSFFDYLSTKTIISSPTNRSILDKGVKFSVDDICVSVKCYHGHVKDLLDNQDIDYVFVPRIVREAKGKHSCPKLIALPDLIKNAFVKYKDRIIEGNFYFGYRPKLILNEFLKIGRTLGASDIKIKKAYRYAKNSFREFLNIKFKGYNFLQALDLWEGKEVEKKERSDILIGISGFPYDVYDEFLNGGLLVKLKALSVDFISSDMIPANILKKQTKKLPKDLFWYQSNMALKAGLYFLDRKDVQGVVVISSFGCGLSAIYTKLLELYNKRVTKKPLMIITIDEQTGDAGLQTRIEAFIDMIRMKRGGL